MSVRKMVTAEDFKTLEELVDKWKGLQTNGHLSLSQAEKLKVNFVYNKIFKKTFCLHCPAEILDAFTKVFRQYDAQK